MIGSFPLYRRRKTFYHDNTKGTTKNNPWSTRPTTGFWLVGLGLALALALLSLIFGDSRVPSVTSSKSRLTQALSSRQGLTTAKAGFRSLPA